SGPKSKAWGEKSRTVRFFKQPPLRDKVAESYKAAHHGRAPSPIECFQDKRNENGNRGEGGDQRLSPPQPSCNLQVSRLRVCTAEELRKEEGSDTEVRKQDNALDKHQTADLVDHQSTSHAGGGNDEKYADDRIKDSKDHKNKVRRR